MMAIPLRYNARSLLYRKTATILTVAGVAVTVALMIILMAVNEGFGVAMKTTGRVDNLVCMREGATSESESGLSRADAAKIRAISGVAAGKDGTPLVSAEVYAGINLPRVNGGSTNVALRGVSPASFEVRGVRIIEGAAPRPGTKEVAVGSRIRGSIKGAEIGGTIRFQNEDWDVVGVHGAGGTAFDSEIWGDVELIMQLFDRPTFTTVVLRAASGTDIGEAAVYEGDIHERVQVRAATGLRGLIQENVGSVKAMGEREYFESQSGFLGGVILALTLFITVLMSAGASAGCINTMFAAVAGRTAEIGGLKAVGFRPWPIFLGFLFESVLLTLVGGVLGVLCTLPLDGFEASTTNWQTFTEIAFALEVSGKVIGIALGVALLIGVVGGSLPALRAARLRPVDALRR